MRRFEHNDIIVPRKYLREWTTASLMVDRVDGDGTLHAFPLGGGFQLRFDPIKVEELDFIKVPKDKLENPEWSSIDVYAEWIEKSYKAWTTGQRWNGWVMPFFEFDEAMRYAQDAGNTVYEPGRDAFISTMEGSEDEPEVDLPTIIYVRGRGPLKVYPIGAGSWTWSMAPEEDEDD